MTETEFWERMTAHFGADYAGYWANQTVIEALGGRTPVEAINDGVGFKTVWRAVWAFLELPASLR